MKFTSFTVLVLATTVSAVAGTSETLAERDLLSTLQTDLQAVQVAAAKAVIGLSAPLINFCNTFVSVPTATVSKTITGNVYTYATSTVTSTPVETTTVTPTTLTETFYSAVTANETTTLSTTVFVSAVTATTTQVFTTPLATQTNTITVQSTELHTAPLQTVTNYFTTIYDRINAKERMLKQRRATATAVSMPTPLRAFASNVVSSACQAFTSTSTITNTKTQTNTIYTSTSILSTVAPTSTVTSTVTGSASVTLPSIAATSTETDFYPGETDTVYTSTSVETDTVTADTSTATELSTATQTVSQTVSLAPTTVPGTGASCVAPAIAQTLFTASGKASSGAAACNNGNANFVPLSGSGVLQLVWLQDTAVKVAIDVISPAGPSGSLPPIIQYARLVNADNSCQCWTRVSANTANANSAIRQAPCSATDPNQRFTLAGSTSAGYQVSFGSQSNYCASAQQFGTQVELNTYSDAPTAYRNCYLWLYPAGSSTLPSSS